jgi:hypothetical protein
MIRSRVVLFATLSALVGCAPIVETTRPSSASPTAKAASTQSAVITITGTPSIKSDRDFNIISSELRTALIGRLGSQGITALPGEGTETGDKKPGIRVLVTLHDYHYVSQGMRIGFGVMAGNSYINGVAEILDRQTGARLAQQTINTSSSAWHGVFGAAIGKQIETFADEVSKVVMSVR